MRDFLAKFNLTPETLLVMIIFIAFVCIITTVAVRITNHFFKKTTDRLLSIGNPNVTYFAFLRYVVLAVIYIAAATAIITNTPLEKTLTTLLGAGGIVAVVIGFASQEAMGNVVSGLMILTFKPFVIGDFVRYVDKNIVGTIEDITLRHIVIRTPENKRVVVPNGTINKEVIENANYKDDKVCVFLDIGITYESSIDAAMEIITKEVLRHKDFLDNRTDEEKEKGVPALIVRVVELADSSVNLRAWLWAKDNGTAFVMRCDLMHSVKNALEAGGVDIAYPHMVVMNK